MPDHSLKGFAMWGYGFLVNDWDQNHRVTNHLGVAAISADHAEYPDPPGLRLIQGMDNIGADIALGIATTDREHHDRVLVIGATGAKPGRKYGLPAFVIGPGRQLGDIVDQ